MGYYCEEDRRTQLPLIQTNELEKNNSKSYPLCDNPSSYPKFLAVIKLKKVWEQVDFYEDQERQLGLVLK